MNVGSVESSIYHVLETVSIVGSIWTMEIYCETWDASASMRKLIAPTVSCKLEMSRK